MQDFPDIASPPRLAPDDIVRELRHLPSTPKVLPRLKHLLADSNSSIYEIVALIRLDPGIAARVLQVSNSAYFSQGTRCHTVEEAVGRVGFNQIYELVSFAVASQVLVRPPDDAAGLAVSEKLDAQSRRVKAATTNVQNAVSFIQTADGFMGGMTKILSRMSELAILAKDVTKNPTDVALYQKEFGSLQDQLRDTIGGPTAEIGGSVDVTTPLGAFNGITLFGSNSTGLTVTIGQAVGQNMTIAETNLRQGSLLSMIAKDSSGSYTAAVTDSSAISNITGSIQQVATERAILGASQSRLELATTTLQVEYENLSSAISRIRDVDVAEESTQYAKYNILVQSGTAMLAQANQMPSSVLKLLQG